jgi:hypothetical protein
MIDRMLAYGNGKDTLSGGASRPLLKCVAGATERGGALSVCSSRIIAGAGLAICRLAEERS